MTNKEIVQKIYLAFGQGNIPEVLNAMSDEIVIDTPGPEMISWAGIRKGKSGAMDFFSQVGSSTVYEQFEPQDFIAEGDKVVAIGFARFTTTSTGKKAVSPWIMAWTIKNGKTVHVKNHWDTYAIAETLK